LQRLALAVPLPGKFRILMQKAFDGTPMRYHFKSATAKLSLNELPAPAKMLAFGFQNCCAHTFRHLM